MTMPKLSVSAFCVFGLCMPLLSHAAYGDPASPAVPAKPVSYSIKVVVQAGAAPRSYDLIVSSRNCASAKSKAATHEDEITMCLQQDDARLDVNWFTRQAGSEYRSNGSLVVTRGQTAELGTVGGPRLAVTIQ